MIDSKHWEPWQHMDLINSMRANGAPEANLKYVEEGLYFVIDHGGLGPHFISPGVAIIDGYRIKLIASEPIIFIPNDTTYIFAVLKRIIDLDGGYNNAWIEIETAIESAFVPPTDPFLLLGWVKTSGLSLSEWRWYDNLLQILDPLDKEQSAKIQSDKFEIDPDLGLSGDHLIGDLKQYYKLDETEVENFCYSAVALCDALSRHNPVYPVRGRRNLGQLFAGILGVGYGALLNNTPSALLDGGNQEYSIAIWVNILDDTLIQQIVIKGDPALNQRDYNLEYFSGVPSGFEFKVGDGVNWSIPVFIPISPGEEKNCWHLIVCGYDLSYTSIFISLDNSDYITQNIAPLVPQNFLGSIFQLGAGVGGINYMVGIVDEFGKWEKKLTRREIDYLWNQGAGNTYIEQWFGQTVVVTIDPTTTSTSYIDLPEMVITLKTGQNPVMINFSSSFEAVSGNPIVDIIINIDGGNIANTQREINYTGVGSDFKNVATSWLGKLAPGIHIFKIKWRVSVGSARSVSDYRGMQVMEMK